MKLTAGMGTIEQYIPYVQAGADEIFAGFVPESWQLKYGISAALNRREVCFVPVQLGSESDLKILRSMTEVYGVPVTLTFNGLHFRPEQFQVIAEIMEGCTSLGFRSFIIADPALLVYLHEKGLTGDFDLHLSGEAGEINRFSAAEYERLGISRLIFHRKVPIADMKEIISRCGAETEFEAFFLNENCQFHGGYCNSLHCDELPPMCRVPYVLKKLNGGEENRGKEFTEYEGIGESGCGLCALPELKNTGITHLKIVGRGAYTENMVRDIGAAKGALHILENTENADEYRREMLRTLLQGNCSGNCYTDIGNKQLWAF